MELREFQLKTLEMLLEVDKILKKNNLKYFLLYGSTLGAIRHNGFIPWDDDIDIGLYRREFEKMEKILQKELSEKYLYCRVGKNRIPNAPIGYLYDISDRTMPLSEVPTIDIFPIDNIPDNRILQKIQLFFSKVYHLCVYRNPSKNRGKKAYYITKIILSITPKFMLDFLEKVSKKIIIFWKDRPTKFIGNILAGAEGKDIRLYSDFNEGVLKKFENHEFLVPECWDKYLKQIYGNYMILPPQSEQKPKHKNI